VERSKLSKKEVPATAFVPAKGTVSITPKRKNTVASDVSSPSKRARTVTTNLVASPAGITWDSNNYSCAYDSLLTILYDFWHDNPRAWTRLFKDMNEHLSMLSDRFLALSNSHVSFEQIRDQWRTILHNQNPQRYPRGPVGISVAQLASELFKVDTVVSSSQHNCTCCEYAEDPVDDGLGYVVHADSSVTGSTSEWIDKMSQKTRRACPDCRTMMQQILFYNDVPPILVLEYPWRNIVTSHKLEFETENGTKTLDLRGIVYHGQYHFTSRIISSQKQVWYHDGMTTGKTCSYDGQLNDMQDNNLRKCRQRHLTLAIYIQKL